MRSPPSSLFLFSFLFLIDLTLAVDLTQCPDNFTNTGPECFQETKEIRHGSDLNHFNHFKTACRALDPFAKPFSFQRSRAEITEILEQLGTGTVMYWLNTIREMPIWNITNFRKEFVREIMPLNKECAKPCLLFNAVNFTRKASRCNQRNIGLCFLPSFEITAPTKFPVTQEQPFVRNDLWMPNADEEDKLRNMEMPGVSHGWSAWADVHEGQPTQCVHTGCESQGILQEMICYDCDSAISQERTRCDIDTNILPYAVKWMKFRTTVYKVTCDGVCSDFAVSATFNTAGKLYLEEGDPTSFSSVLCGAGSGRKCLKGPRQVVSGGGTVRVKSSSWEPLEISGFYMTVVASQTGKVSLDVVNGEGGTFAQAQCHESYDA